LGFRNRWNYRPDNEQQENHQSCRSQQRQGMTRPNPVGDRRLGSGHRFRRRGFFKPFFAQFCRLIIFVKFQRLLVSSQRLVPFTDPLVKFAQESVCSNEVPFQPNRPPAKQNRIVISAFVSQLHRLSQQIFRRNFRQFVSGLGKQILTVFGSSFAVKRSATVSALFNPIPYCVAAVPTKGRQLGDTSELSAASLPVYPSPPNFQTRSNSFAKTF